MSYNFPDIYKISENIDDYEAQSGVIRMPPVWGRDLSASEFYNFSQSRNTNGRYLLLPAELGCSLAHINCYNEIFRGGRSAIIIESDIFFGPKEKIKIERLLSSFPEADFIHLAEYKHNFKKIKVAEDLYIPDTSDGFWGTAAYYVSPAMAGFLLERHKKFIDLADNWQEFFVDCPFLPLYSPVFKHYGEFSTIQNIKLGLF